MGVHSLLYSCTISLPTFMKEIEIKKLEAGTRASSWGVCPQYLHVFGNSTSSFGASECLDVSSADKK